MERVQVAATSTALPVKAATAKGQTSMSSKEFFKFYKIALEHDFQKDGEPVPFAPGHPKQWGSEQKSIQLGGSEPASHVALNHDESLLAVGQRDKILIYEISSLKLVRTIEVGGEVVYCEFHPAENTLVYSFHSGLGRARQSIIKILTADDLAIDDVTVSNTQAKDTSATAVTLLEQEMNWTLNESEKIDLHNNIHQLIRSTESEIDVRNGRAYFGTLFSFGSKAFSPNGSNLFYHNRENKEIVVLDPSMRRERFRLTGHTGAIMWVGSPPHGRIIGSSAWDATVRLWDSSTGAAIRTLHAGTAQSWAGAFSSDGSLIAAGSGDKNVRVWRVETGELIHTLGGFQGWIRALAFSPDGLHLSAGADGGTFRIFDSSTGQRVQHWQSTGADEESKRWSRSFTEVRSVQYDAKGRVVFRPSDGRTFMFDPSRNLKLQFERREEIQGDYGEGNSIVMKGGVLISADSDATIRFWNIE